MRCILINDTSKTNHFGCKILNLNLRSILKKKKIKIVKICYNSENYDYSLEKIKKIDADFILINGEGTIHHDQKEFLNILNLSIFFFKKKIPVYLINSTVQKISYKYLKFFKNYRKIYVREKLSKNYLKKYGIFSKVVPDLIFYKKISKIKSTKKFNLMITDSAIKNDTKKLFEFYNLNKSGSFFTPLFFLKNKILKKKTTKIKFLIYKLFYFFFPNKLNVYSIFSLKNYRNLISKLISSTFLISGRFHMIALSILFKIPFYYTKSNTYKIDGLLKDIKIKGRKFNFKKRETLIFNEFTKSENKLIDNYLNNASLKIENMFDEIINDKKIYENKNI